MQKLSIGIAIIIFVFVAGIGISSTITAPAHAIVYVDEQSETYLSPPCLPKEQWKYHPEMTMGDMQNLTLKISKSCVNKGGFVQEGRSMSGMLLVKLGVLDQLESRWNHDGSWNW